MASHRQAWRQGLRVGWIIGLIVILVGTGLASVTAPAAANSTAPTVHVDTSNQALTTLPLLPPQGVSAPSIGTNGEPPAASGGGDEWVNAWTDQNAQSGFDGLRGTVDAISPAIPCPGSGHIDYDWAGVEARTSANDVVDMGFFVQESALSFGVCGGSGPYPYYWAPGTGIEAVCSGGPLSVGPHVFSASVITGTNTWTFTVDGNTIAGTTFNWGNGGCSGPAATGEVKLNSSTATETSLWSGMEESTTSSTQSFWPMPTVLLPSAFSVFSGGAWTQVPVGLAARYPTSGATPAFGIQGQKQNASLGPDAIVIGNSFGWPSPSQVLWAPALQVGATATSPTTGLAPLPVSFSATVTGGTGSYSSYDWFFGDQSTGSGATVSHTYTAAGTFLVTVEVTDSGSETQTSAPIAVTVTSALAATASASPTTADAGQSVTFSCSGNGGVAPLSYSWSFGDGSNGSGASTSHSYASSGAYTATCTIVDARGVVSKASVTVTVNSNVLGLPATEGYEVIGAGIAAAIVLVVVALLISRGRKKRREAPQPYSPTPTPPGESPPSNP